jgi:imidazolonepropionase-like amidohydrolase
MMIFAAAPNLTKLATVVSLALACAGNPRTLKNSEVDTLFALTGGKIYTSPDRAAIDSGVLLIRGGLIVAVGRADAVSIPSGAETLDCSGLAVLAGFWNSHVHFTEPHWSGADTISAVSLTRHLREMLTRYGFVHVLDTGSWLANTLTLRRRIESGEVSGPAILTTGPGFVPVGGSPFYILPDTLPELRSAGNAEARVASRFQEGADAIKLFTSSVASPTRVVPMPLDVVRAATREAHRRGKPVLAHPTNNAGVQAVLEGEVDILAHTTPDGGPWEEGLAGRLKEGQVALIPTLRLWKFELTRRGADPVLMQRFLGAGIAQLRTFVETGGEILFGTDVGYMTEYDPTEEYLYMQEAGMSFRQILAALTTAPAKRFGIPGQVNGSLEPGVEADVVVLEQDPAQDIRALARVRYALRKGRRVYSAALVSERRSTSGTHSPEESPTR